MPSTPAEPTCALHRYPLRLPSTGEGVCSRTGPRFPVRLPTESPLGPLVSAIAAARHGPLRRRVPASEYPEAMNESTSKPLGRTIIAGLVLLIAAWLLLHFVIGIVTAIASVLVVVLAIVAVIWALRVLL
jgi:hypothetical protein